MVPNESIKKPLPCAIISFALLYPITTTTEGSDFLNILTASIGCENKLYVINTSEVISNTVFFIFSIYPEDQFGVFHINVEWVLFFA
jgi:hypothetical protein